MKVLQINSVCGIGSTGRIATDIDTILKDQGHESYIAYGRGTARNTDTSIKIGNSLDNYLHVAKTRALDKHGFGSIRATKNFIENIKELDPDVIHLHNIHGYYLNIEILFNYLKEANKPVVWTLHDCWAFTGHCAHFDFVGCDKWKTGCFECPEKKAYPSSKIDNSKFNYTKKKDLFTGVKKLTIVTPSQWLARLVKESFLKEYPVEVINNGIDLNFFKPIKSNFRKTNNINNKFVILGVANVWGHRKGLNYFIELSKELEENEVIVLVGLDSQQSKNLSSNILGIEKTNSIKELAEIYSAADVFVNPTLEDTYPTTNLEALVCGVPVITYNTGGSPESINYNNGLVLNEKNSIHLYNAIQIIKRKLKEREIVPELIAKLARESFNKNSKFKDYINLYINLIRERN